MGYYIYKHMHNEILCIPQNFAESDSLNPSYPVQWQQENEKSE